MRYDAVVSSTQVSCILYQYSFKRGIAHQIRNGPSLNPFLVLGISVAQGFLERKCGTFGLLPSAAQGVNLITYVQSSSGCYCQS